MSSPAIYMLVPAAGIGSRFGANQPKQYVDLIGKPVIRHTLDVCLSFSAITQVWVMIAPEDHHWPNVYPEGLPLRLSVGVGGKTRAHSVYQGVLALGGKAKDTDWVLVHDVVRPCVSEVSMARLIEACKDHPVGGLLGLPATHTIKQVDDSCCVQSTFDKNQIWRAQTPQCFRFGVLKKAMDAASANDFRGITDTASAVEQLGLRPMMVRGEQRNIKITYQEDLLLAQWYLAQGE